MGRQKKDKNIGRRLGFLVVQRFDKDTGCYECLCDCGAAVALTETQVRRSSVKACDACRKKLPSRGKDISAKQYGVLRVKYPYVSDDGVPRRLWVCECSSCGRESLHKSGALKSGSEYSCPVCGAGRRSRDRERRSFSLTGQTFGDFTVRGRNAIKNNDGSDEWVCTCNKSGRPAAWVYQTASKAVGAPSVPMPA